MSLTTTISQEIELYNYKAMQILEEFEKNK